jgi:hypothetical protein
MRMKEIMGWLLVTVGLVWILLFGCLPTYQQRRNSGDLDKPVPPEAREQALLFARDRLAVSRRARAIVLFPTALVVIGFVTLLGNRRESQQRPEPY